MSSMDDQKTQSVPEAIGKRSPRPISKFPKALAGAFAVGIFSIGSMLGIAHKGGEIQKDLKPITQNQYQAKRSDIANMLIKYVAGELEGNQRDDVRDNIILQNAMLKKWNTKAHDENELEDYKEQILKDIGKMPRIIIDEITYTLIT